MTTYRYINKYDLFNYDFKFVITFKINLFNFIVKFVYRTIRLENNHKFGKFG